MRGGICMWQYWLIIAGAFMIGEIMTVGFLLFWFGIGAIIAMIVSFFTSNLIIQTTVFIVSSVVLIFATKPFVRKFLNQKTVMTNAFSLVGKKGIVIQDINAKEGTGQIKVNGEIWSAESETEDSITKGTEVEITQIVGVKTLVKPLPKTVSSI